MPRKDIFWSRVLVPQERGFEAPGRFCALSPMCTIRMGTSDQPGVAEMWLREPLLSHGMFQKAGAPCVKVSFEQKGMLFLPVFHSARDVKLELPA